MKFIALLLLLVFGLILDSNGDPAAGICMHASGPTLPPDKVMVFEYSRIERIEGARRFFLPAGGNAVISDYRLRSVVPYPTQMLATDANFEDTLTLLTNHYQRYPATRPFLQSWVQRMNAQSKAVKEAAEHQATLSRVKIGGMTYVAPKFSEFRGDKVMIRHQQGVAGIPLAELSDQDISTINSIEMVFRSRIVVGEVTYHNPAFKSIEEGAVTLVHAGGKTRLPTANMSAPDMAAINSLSDDSWKVGPAGFVGFSAASGAYKELVMEDGRKFTNVKLDRLSGEAVICTTKTGNLEMTFGRAAELPGLGAPDRQRLDEWCEAILEARKEKAPIKSTKEVVRFLPAVDPAQPITGIRANVMQVPSGGVLVSSFVGARFIGTNEIRRTDSRSYRHPLTGKSFTETIGSRDSTETVNEPVAETLCYISCDNQDVVDGQVVNFSRLVRNGTYQYTAINGAARTVPRYDER